MNVLYSTVAVLIQNHFVYIKVNKLESLLKIADVFSWIKMISTITNYIGLLPSVELKAFR